MDRDALVGILTSPSGNWDEMVKEISCPILLVTPTPGRGIVNPGMVQEAAGLWKQGQEARVRGAGHCIHRDRFHPYMKKIKAFLREM
jgi:hypothetical protein